MTTNKNDERMKQACDLASMSIHLGGGPFGAIITDKNDNIIGKGHNRVTMDNDPTQHAEIVAIRNACSYLKDFQLSGCSLYTSCEPCPMCLSAIYWSRIDTIYYANSRKDAQDIGFDDDFIYEEIKKENKERKIVMNKMSNDYSEIAFREWKNKTDKKEY
jgi:tRNA(Arg) A34 adenosine deaminase TadA